MRGGSILLLSSSNTKSAHLSAINPHTLFTMSPLNNAVIPKGSLVLVTGANGLMGSHVAKQFLEYGYKVRGTVRDTTKFSWLLELFQNDYGKDSFELVQVDDLAAKGAFDEAVKGKFN